MTAATEPVSPALAVLPPGGYDFAADAVVAGGGRVVEPEQASALVWTAVSDSDGLGRTLDDHPQLRWVQLPFAGVEPYADLIRAHADRTWTCAKGAYADPVAEHALALALAGLRQIDRYARKQRWSRAGGRNLYGAKVTILGGGGIAASLLRLLAPFGCEVTVVRRTLGDMPGVARVLAPAATDEALTGAEVVVLALALVPATVGVIDARRLALMPEGAVLVNVARGRHVVTDDLVEALRSGHLGSAGLDVTDPEPLPDGHVLWTLPNAIITPHTANTVQMLLPLLTARIRENVGRWAAGEPLVGLVDPVAGY